MINGELYIYVSLKKNKQTTPLSMKKFSKMISQSGGRQKTLNASFLLETSKPDYVGDVRVSSRRLPPDKFTLKNQAPNNQSGVGKAAHTGAKRKSVVTRRD